ncbi:hypothetical protein [Glaciimonas immobilis]|uniref:Uncharacterized protein n=1 Tax=Glaciimonas immobilis TaxID=728004 RepID=A0A840RVK0_9BURK|nr:hypothetical protein [Glaciimonas immobilis]KAF3996178.1 hypothetical protein HAV38_20805 [Glaciimonas immobilis]MBB5202667.1 hypothetical protein [Glaciimonas immobilis]
MGFIPFEVVSISEAKAVLDWDKPADKKEIQWELLRRTQRAADIKLSDATYKWVSTIPKDIWPLWLMKSFPRIANQLANTWAQPAGCDALFTQLLLDQRGTRKGFPVEVSREIMALKLYFESL